MKGFLKKMRLNSLYGRERMLGRQIGQAYANGKYVPELRKQQQEVRRAIRLLEQEDSE